MSRRWSPGIQLRTHASCQAGVGNRCHRANGREVPFSFWQHLDRAARQMGLYSSDSDGFHRESAEVCRRHLVAGPESRGMSQPAAQDEIIS